MNNMWTVRVEENELGDLVLPLPAELMSEMGWDENTILVWEELDDGKISLASKEIRDDGKTSDG
jgi:hypothetical protein